jgi:hypothetical protein
MLADLKRSLASDYGVSCGTAMKERYPEVTFWHAPADEAELAPVFAA